MYQLFMKTIITLICILLCSISFSQDSGTFKVSKKEKPAEKESRNFNKGFALGYEYFSGHSELSRLFKIKRNPKHEYKIGHGVYVDYFNKYCFRERMGYRITAGGVFWNEQNTGTEIVKGSSGFINFTGSYSLGGEVDLQGKFGGFLNRNAETRLIGTEMNQINTTTFSISYGVGVLYSHGMLSLGFNASKIGEYNMFSITVSVPIIFTK